MARVKQEPQSNYPRRLSFEEVAGEIQVRGDWWPPPNLRRVTVDELWRAFCQGDFHARNGSTRLTWLPSHGSDEVPAKRGIFEVLGVRDAVYGGKLRLLVSGSRLWRALAEIPVSDIDEHWIRSHFLKIRIHPEHLLKWIEAQARHEVWGRIVGVLEAALRAQKKRPELKANASATAQYLLENVSWNKERYRHFPKDSLRRIIGGTYKAQKFHGIPGVDGFESWRSQRGAKKSRGRARRSP